MVDWRLEGEEGGGRKQGGRSRSGGGDGVQACCWGLGCDTGGILGTVLTVGVFLGLGAELPVQL